MIYYKSLLYSIHVLLKVPFTHLHNVEPYSVAGKYQLNLLK